jgi:hypothetical protein
MITTITIMTIAIMMGTTTTGTITTAIEVWEMWRCGIFPAPPTFHSGAGHSSRRVSAGCSGLMHLRRMNAFVVCLITSLAGGAAGPCSGQLASAEPTKEGCEAAVEQTRALAAALPADDLSRYFAERDLHQAMVEAGNGEFDDCVELAARATEEIKERRHVLQPGERLNVLKSDE